MGVPQRQLGAKVDKEQEQESLAGVLLPHWVGGKDAALDVTVVNPCQAATVVGAATTAGHALNHTFQRKVRGAEEVCQR